MLDTQPLIMDSDFPAITRHKTSILQLNLGYLCNLSCTHCHVNAGPRRTELMTWETIETALAFVRARHIKIVDLTGGAPEMNPHFKSLVVALRQEGCEVIDRCNLTILEHPGYEWLAEFLAEQGVIVTASLPCYSEQNVDKQRGKGVFEESIEGLQRLNKLGYGKAGSGLELNLVYNPGGAFLPPSQPELEADYKRELFDDFGIQFNQLFTLANMPISRFGSQLLSKGEFHSYMKLLRDSYQASNLDSLMCRSLVSVDWQGYVYDCDFNQMLDMPLLASDQEKPMLADLLAMSQDIDSAAVAVANHCYGCTAGQGSSCGGALNES